MNSFSTSQINQANQITKIFRPVSLEKLTETPLRRTLGFYQKISSQKPVPNYTKSSTCSTLVKLLSMELDFALELNDIIVSFRSMEITQRTVWTIPKFLIEPNSAEEIDQLFSNPLRLAFFLRFIKPILNKSSSGEFFSFVEETTYEQKDLDAIKSFINDPDNIINNMAKEILLTVATVKNLNRISQFSLSLNRTCLEIIFPFIASLNKIYYTATPLLYNLSVNHARNLQEGFRDIHRLTQSHFLASQWVRDNCESYILEIERAHQLEYFPSQLQFYQYVCTELQRLSPGSRLPYTSEKFTEDASTIIPKQNPKSAIVFELELEEDEGSSSSKPLRGKTKKKPSIKSLEATPHSDHGASSSAAPPKRKPEILQELTKDEITKKPSSLVSKEIFATPSEVQKQLIHLFKTRKGFKNDERVVRWRKKPVEQTLIDMENFVDKGKFKYRGMKLSKKLEMLIYHELGSALDSFIFHPEMKDIYTYPTETGAGCFAEIVTDDGSIQKQGVLLFGFDRALQIKERPYCYHRLFEERSSKIIGKDSYDSIFQSKEPLENGHGSSEESEEEQDDFYTPENYDEIFINEYKIKLDSQSGILSIRDKRLKATLQIYRQK